MTLLAAGAGTAASCRGYGSCTDGSGICAPEVSSGGAPADGGESADGGRAGERALGGGATGEGGEAGNAAEDGTGGAGKAGRGGAAARSDAGDGGAGDGTGGDGGDGDGTGAVGGIIAGDAGEAGRAGPSCEARFGDCDGSTLNGCETNVWESVRHCGACARECAGLCDRGACLEFDRLVPGQFSPEIIALAPDYAFLAARDASNVLHLRRVSRWTGAIQTISSDDPWTLLHASAVVSRVYLADGFQLKSVALDGTDPRAEGLSVESIATSGDFLYFTWLGGLYSWSEKDREAVLVREFAAAASIHLAAGTPGLFIAVNYPAGSEPSRYELHFLEPTFEPSLWDTGEGVAGGLVAAHTDAYFIVQGGKGVELRHVPHGGQAFVLDADASALVELAAVTGGVFATFSTEASWGLRYYAFNAQPIRYEWETRGDLLRLTSTVDGELWFVDSSQATLARVESAELHDLGP